MNQKTMRDMVIETNRDVKWIRACLSEIKEKESELELRVRNLEDTAGNTRRISLKESQISAGAGAGAGGFVAVLMKFFGG
jgi:hypothetical protein